MSTTNQTPEKKTLDDQFSLFKDRIEHKELINDTRKAAEALERTNKKLEQRVKKAEVEDALYKKSPSAYAELITKAKPKVASSQSAVVKGKTVSANAPPSRPEDSQSPDTVFAAFDKDINKQMTSHVMGAVTRGLDKSRRNFAKEIAAEAIGHMPDGLGEAIDKLPNAKVFEILTAHQQTQEFRQQNLEAKKSENEVVSKEIDNTKKSQELISAAQSNQVKLDKDKVDLGIKEEE